MSLPQESSSSDWAFERAVLEKLFPEKHPDINWQKVAVATALKNRFSVISGGPGTGKTTTVAKLLVALQEKQQHQQQQKQHQHQRFIAYLVFVRKVIYQLIINKTHFR